jgi:(2Fe-2S) ferredoxin
MNIVNFPICRVVNGRHWYGGRSFNTKDEVVDAMSDKDWRRIVQWHDRHAGRIAGQAEKQA